MTQTLHVVPVKDGGWTIQDEPGHARRGNGASATLFERKRDAEAHAKDLLRQQGGGEVILHTPSGHVTEIDTVSPESSVAST